MIIETINILLLLTIVLGLWWLWCVLHNQYRIDYLRHQLFSIRDDLFEEALETGLPFNSKAYCLTRNTLNSMIRFAHDISITRVVASYILMSDYRKLIVSEYNKNINQALSEIEPGQKKSVARAMDEMHLAVIEHLVCNALPVWIVVKIAEGIFRLKIITANSKRARRNFAYIDVEATCFAGGSC